MTQHQLLALIEFDEGCFHSHHCHRYIVNRPFHAQMSAAQDWLLTKGLIELVGNDYQVTEDGREILTRTVTHAADVVSEYLG